MSFGLASARTIADDGQGARHGGELGIYIIRISIPHGVEGFTSSFESSMRDAFALTVWRSSIMI
jgi:hypothetical protein